MSYNSDHLKCLFYLKQYVKIYLEKYDNIIIYNMMI